MSVSSLRPERSASANSATPAQLCGLYFISKGRFVNYQEAKTFNMEGSGTNLYFSSSPFHSLHNRIADSLQYY